MADKILIQIQRLGPDFSDYAHCEYINIKIQTHKCRFTNTKTEYKNTQIQIGKFKDKKDGNLLYSQYTASISTYTDGQKKGYISPFLDVNWLFSGGSDR